VFTSALRSNVRGATLRAQKTQLFLLLRDRRVYRCAASKLPEQIRYNIKIKTYITTSMLVVMYGCETLSLLILR
jgi:hypothetical protein